MPTDAQLHLMNALHRGILKLSGGRLGWRVMSMPVVELTTIGNKSGQPRTVMLTSPLQQGDTLVVVASRGGDDHHPGWFHNLSANPEVQVAVGGGPRRPMRARVATADERAAMWPQVTSAYKGYANYQTKTSREIPLVVLEPLTG